MSHLDNIRVLPVPSELVEAMWPHVAPLLEKGLTAAQTSTLDGIRRDLDNGTDHLWCVWHRERLAAAFITAVYIDQGSYLGVYALGGRGLWKWARVIDVAMQDEAKRRGVDRIRFMGRRAWGRVLRHLKHRGAMMGHEIWERAA